MRVVNAEKKENKMRILCMVVLLICVLFDVHSKKIPAVWIWISIFLCMGYRIWEIAKHEGIWYELLIAIIPGILVYIVSQMSREIGEGDGLLMIAIGGLFYLKEIIMILCIALVLAGVFSMGYVVIRRKYRGVKIPFTPFLFLASWMVMTGDTI